MIGIKQIIEVRKFNKERPKVEDIWCAKQIEDFERIILLMEDLVETAVASHSSAHQYSTLNDAKLTFTQSVLDIAENYRLISTK